MFNCNICNTKTDINEGGAALMMTLCVGHSTNLINVSLCKECYQMFAEKPLKELNEKAMLNICFGDANGEGAK